jgi:nickel-dependent lactate racemase
VVASCGGYPKDINFIQAHKAIHNSAAFVKDGGTLIIFAECIDNIGSQTFLPWYEKGGFPGAFKALEKKYEGNGGTALAMMTKTQRIKIMLVSKLDSSLCSQLSVQKCKTAEVQKFLSSSKGKTAWIPNASLLVRRTETTQA